MQNINQVTLLGQLATDVNYKSTTNSAVANFDLATNHSWKDEQGQWQNKASYHKIVAWGKLAENAKAQLWKGQRCLIQGRLETRIYEKDSSKRYITEVIADKVIAVAFDKDNQPQPQAQGYGQPMQPAKQAPIQAQGYGYQNNSIPMNQQAVAQHNAQYTQQPQQPTPGTPEYYAQGAQAQQNQNMNDDLPF